MTLINTPKVLINYQCRLTHALIVKIAIFKCKMQFRNQKMINKIIQIVK